MFADGSDLLFRDSLTLVDSVEFWLCKDYNDSAVKLSFKVSSFPSLHTESFLIPRHQIAECIWEFSS